MASSTLSKLVLLLVALMLAVPQCSSQYHYSNWWHAGGKRNVDLVDDRRVREECGTAVEGLVNTINRVLVREILKLTSTCGKKVFLPHTSESTEENLKKFEGQFDDKRWK